MALSRIEERPIPRQAQENDYQKIVRSAWQMDLDHLVIAETVRSWEEGRDKGIQGYCCRW